MNKVIAVLSTVILLFVSFWLGEAGKGLFQLCPYMIGLIGAVAIPYFISKKWKLRILYGFLFTVIYAAAFYIGNFSFCRAYNSCLQEAEQIRTVLSDYKAKNGKYPDVLDDLKVPLPCSRWLRGTIVEYESTDSNYKLWFEDWVVEHSATATEPIIAHK